MTADDFDREPVPGDVSVQLSYPYNSHTGRRGHLTVTDRMSGLTLVEVDLTAGQVMDLMAHTSVRVSGATLPARPDLIGKRMETDSTTVGHNDERDPEQVRVGYLVAGWDTAQVRRTNSGHQVTARRWVDPAAGDGE
ncbi:hypothetical protein ABZ671_01115 [Micromonospora sp. NPDC006766]|uniref:hypothetical protein n=1 Tax=Micromonospora sp. NPDC006766 TaxID=3154778 RepID=UPI0033ED79D9